MGEEQNDEFIFDLVLRKLMPTLESLSAANYDPQSVLKWLFWPHYEGLGTRFNGGASLRDQVLEIVFHELNLLDYLKKLIRLKLLGFDNRTKLLPPANSLTRKTTAATTQMIGF